MERTDIQRRYEDCLRLYREHGGRNVQRIEGEMRALGHERFSRRILYGRVERDVYKPGWIDRYGWRSKFQVSDPKFQIKDSTPSDPRSSSNPGSGIWNMEFETWLKRVSPGMTWDWEHQKLLYEYLEAVTHGECPRLMIFMPPRHGKSETVTVRYTAWRMQQDPTLNVILGSYNQRLANRFSRKVRRVMAEAAVGRSADTLVRTDAASASGTSSANRTGSTSNDTHAAGGVADRSVRAPSRTPHRSRFANSESEWETRDGGGMRAVGVGSGVTGFGANLIIIDDPVKSRAEAESKTFRDNVWDWFNDDISTRLEPKGAIILIQTRWHEDDLAGRLIKEMKQGGERWEILSLPALAEGDPTRIPDPNIPDSKFQISDPGSSPDLESGIWDLESKDQLGRRPGQALCPDRYDEAALEKLHKKLGSYSFSALFQQRPTPPDGGLFKRKWFKIVDQPPPGLVWKRGWDLAVSTRTDSDFTASFRCAFDDKGNLYVADGIRLRIEFPEQRRLMLDRFLFERNTEHGVELAIHGQALIQDLRRIPAARAAAFRGVRVDSDKITRALAWAPLAEEGKVFLVRGRWNQDLIQEAAAFPRSPHDDQIDAISIAVSMLAKRGRLRPYGF